MTSPKEAQGLQADLESLKRRQLTLEDEVIELMERIEPLDEQLGASVVALAAIDAERAQVKASLSSSENAVDNELAETLAARQALVEAVPATLITEYERIRGGEGGIGVARLQGATCMGCHISLAAAEVDVMKRMPADELAYCPDCGRLLVR
jgi:predicted  nucleic acid-binding Zn-ribbon protein